MRRTGMYDISVFFIIGFVLILIGIAIDITAFAYASNSQEEDDKASHTAIRLSYIGGGCKIIGTIIACTDISLQANIGCHINDIFLMVVSGT